MQTQHPEDDVLSLRKIKEFAGETAESGILLFSHVSVIQIKSASLI
jgi:hypothetical protein